MTLTRKQIALLKKEYPKKEIQQLAQELKITPGVIYKNLGLIRELWCLRIDKFVGVISVMLLWSAPLFVLSELKDFADLPQRAYIQFCALSIILLLITRLCILSRVGVYQNAIFYLTYGFIVLCFASVIRSADRYLSLYMVVHWTVSCVFLFVISMTLSSNAWIRRLMLSLSAGCGAVVIIGIGQALFKLSWIPQAVAPAATFGNANLAAEYVSIVFPMTATIGVCAWKRPVGWTHLIIALLAITFVYYSQGRAAAAAIVCGILWICLLLVGKSSIFMRCMPAIIGGALIIAMLLCYRADNESIWRLAGSSVAYRVIVWQNTIEMIKEKPLQGFGAGCFDLYYPAYARKAAIDDVLDITKQIRKAHNDYIQIAVELGLIGLCIFLIILLYGLYMAVLTFQSNRLSRQEAVFILGSSGGIISFMVTAFFSFPVQRSLPVLITFCYLGILTAIYRRWHPTSRETNISVPLVLMIAIVIVVTIGTAGWISLQYRNIVSDRYYRTCLEMEGKKSYQMAFAYGMRAHQYNKYRMDIMATVGRVSLAAGQNQKAIELLEPVVLSYPFHLNALTFLAAAYGNSGQPEKALATLRRILAIKPDFKKAQEMVFQLKTAGRLRAEVR